jgi:uncharacterized protein
MTDPTPFCLMTADGVPLVAEVRFHPHPLGAVVVVHGLAASRADARVVAVADAIHQAGFDVVTYDSRGHGDSGGLCTLGLHERLDVEAATALARRRCPDVSLVGASIGGVAALRHAAHDPSVISVVTVSSPARWRVPATPTGLLSVLITRTEPGRYLAAALMATRLAPRWVWHEPPEAVARRLQVPLSVVHGRSDRFIRHGEGRRLFEAAAGPRQLQLIEGMGHAFHRLATAAILDALAWGSGARQGPLPCATP